MEWGRKKVEVSTKEGVGSRGIARRVLWELYQLRHEENKGENGGTGHMRSG